MPTNVPVDAWIRLTASESGGTLTWTSFSNNALNTLVVDDDGDGNADVGVDFWQSSGQTFTGYVIDVGGTDYPVFLSGPIYVIPYNSAIEDISGTFPASGSTSTTTTEAAIPYLCFMKGTRIATPTGAVDVETLKIGDMISTARGGETPVLWLGRQSVANTPSISPRTEPVCIKAGALGKGVPTSDLYVSADHGMILDGLVVNASALVNGTTIHFVPAAEMPETFTYYHIETEAHDVILANGAPAETFIDSAGRAAFDNHGEYVDLYGAERIISEMKMPRITTQRLLPQSLRDRLGTTAGHPRVQVA